MEHEQQLRSCLKAAKRQEQILRNQLLQHQLELAWLQQGSQWPQQIFEGPNEDPVDENKRAEGQLASAQRSDRDPAQKTNHIQDGDQISLGFDCLPPCNTPIYMDSTMKVNPPCRCRRDISPRSAGLTSSRHGHQRSSSAPSQLTLTPFQAERSKVDKSNHQPKNVASDASPTETDPLLALYFSSTKIDCSQSVVASLTRPFQTTFKASECDDSISHHKEPKRGLHPAVRSSSKQTPTDETHVPV